MVWGFIVVTFSVFSAIIGEVETISEEIDIGKLVCDTTVVDSKIWEEWTAIGVLDWVDSVDDWIIGEDWMDIGVLDCKTWSVLYWIELLYLLSFSQETDTAWLQAPIFSSKYNPSGQFK